jgi:hypothetical protein
MEIRYDPNMVETYVEVVKFPGHPFVKWLAKYFDFDPDVTARYTRTRPRRDIYKIGNMFVAHPVMKQDIRTAMIDANTAS